MNCTKQFDQVKWQLFEQTTWCRACEMRHKWFFDHAFYHVLYDCGHVTPVPAKLQDKLHKSCCLPPLNPLRGKDALAFYPNARRFNWTKWWALMCLNYCPLLMLTLQYVFPYKSSLDFYFPSFTLRQIFRLAFYIYGQMCPSLSGSLHNVPGIKTYWKVNPYLQRECIKI